MSSEIASNTNITGVVLAGGMGRRLGGVDKGLLRKDGILFIEHIVKKLSPQVSNILINANRNSDRYAQFGEVIGDDSSGYQGPLAGMQTAMRVCSTDWVVTVPCDGINISKDYVQRLFINAKAAGSQIAVAFDGERLQPVHALIHRSLLASLDNYLNSGERKIDRWYAAENFTKVDFSDFPLLFQNINTPEEKKEINAE